MNAHALLTSQGWRGTGNSLHPTSNEVGLSRPLLVSKKQNTLGIGKKQHKTSDMWWMNAFDSSLKGLDTSKEGQVVQTVTSGGLDMVTKAGAKWVGSKGGLYASFVRGESLSGTITPVEGTESEGDRGKKRKRGSDEESKEERKARKAAKRKAVVVEDKSKDVHESSDTKETKEERRARKAAKKALREEEAKPAESALTEDIPEPYAVKSESKEERKERKRLKKHAQLSKVDIEAAEAEEPKKKKKRRKNE
jgi:nucleolar protein TMA23